MSCVLSLNNVRATRSHKWQVNGLLIVHFAFPLDLSSVLIPYKEMFMPQENARVHSSSLPEMETVLFFDCFTNTTHTL